MLKKIDEFLQGKRTYISMIAILVAAILQYKGIAIPEYVWAALGAVGLGFLRAAVDKVVK